MITTAIRSQRGAKVNADGVSHDKRTNITSFETDLGWMAIAWREDALLGIVFGHASRRNAANALARSSRMLQLHGRLEGG
jgi:hypothetical protein